MTIKRVMLDLETLDKKPGAVIIAIGAVVFTEEGLGKRFYINVDPITCVAAGLTIGASTVMWWMQQSEAARAAFKTKGVPLVEALTAFSDWFPIDNNVVELWGNGSDFDNAILLTAYAKTGIEPPWSYKGNRCYRTLRGLYPSIKAADLPGTHHNALDDVVYQATHAVDILRVINGVNPTGALKQLT
jgi:hypothetical protein